MQFFKAKISWYVHTVNDKMAKQQQKTRRKMWVFI